MIYKSISTYKHTNTQTNMATDSVIKGKSINTDKVTFSAPNTLDNGAKLVYVNYNGGKFTVRTPWMDMPGRCSGVVLYYSLNKEKLKLKKLIYKLRNIIKYIQTHTTNTQTLNIHIKTT